MPSFSAPRQASRACLTELPWDLELPAHISHTAIAGFVSLSLAFSHHLLVCVCAVGAFLSVSICLSKLSATQLSKHAYTLLSDLLQSQQLISHTSTFCSRMLKVCNCAYLRLRMTKLFAGVSKKNTSSILRLSWIWIWLFHLFFPTSLPLCFINEDNENRVNNVPDRATFKWIFCIEWSIGDIFTL